MYAIRSYYAFSGTDVSVYAYYNLDNARKRLNDQRKKDQEELRSSLNIYGNIINKTRLQSESSIGGFPSIGTDGTGLLRITSYNVCYTKLLRGVVDSPSIAHDQAGWIRSNGKVSGTIGAVEVDTNFNPGETLYVAPIGRALISIDSTGSIIGGLLTFTVDSTTITRTINSLSPATTDEHRDNIIKAINDSTAITSTDNFVPKAFISGERATRTVVLTSNLSAGDTVTVNGIILTASVSPSSRLEFEVGPSLFSTILNLTKKINETRDYGATTADAGHKCLAQCNGDCIIIKAIFPGVVANSYVVSSSSAFLTNTGSLLGGTSELTVYKGGRSDLAIALTTTISNITITENWDDFGSSSFLNEFYALSEGESTNRRVKPKYEKRNNFV